MMVGKSFQRLAGWAICLLIFSVVIAGQKAKTAGAIKPRPKIWVSLGHSTLDIKPPDWAWLRAQCANAKVLNTLEPIQQQLGGIVVPVFDDGRTFHNTKVAPFAGRNQNAVENEAALRELLRKARAAKVPVYLALDLLPWQKDPRENDNPLVSRPELEERNQYAFAGAPREARFASPFQKDVRESLASLAEELAARFPEAAGLVLDARLSDTQILGFNRAARAQFALEHKLDPADFGLDNIAELKLNPTLQAWVDWRRAAFAEFVVEAANAYRRRRANGKVFVNGYAEYYTDQNFHDVRTAQDWLAWTRTGHFDGVLLEGRWLEPFSDMDQFNRLRGELSQTTQNVEKQLLLLPVSAGDHLIKTSDYRKEYQSLTNRAGGMDGFVLLAQNDEDVRRVLAFAAGAALPEKPAPFAVDVPLQDFTLPRADGTGEWSSKSLRGERGLALVVAHDSESLRDLHKVLNAQKKAACVAGVELVVISEKAVGKTVGTDKPVHLLDSNRQLIDRAARELTLVLVDRAGYIRRVEPLKAHDELFAHSFNDATPPLEVDKPAPTFSILDSTGGEVRLTDFRSQKNVLLTFFPKCFTDG